MICRNLALDSTKDETRENQTPYLGAPPNGLRFPLDVVRDAAEIDLPGLRVEADEYQVAHAVLDDDAAGEKWRGFPYTILLAITNHRAVAFLAGFGRLIDGAFAVRDLEFFSVDDAT